MFKIVENYQEICGKFVGIVENWYKFVDFCFRNWQNRFFCLFFKVEICRNWSKIEQNLSTSAELRRQCSILYQLPYISLESHHSSPRLEKFLPKLIGKISIWATKFKRFSKMLFKISNFARKKWESQRNTFFFNDLH